MVRRIQHTGGVGSILTAKGGGAGGDSATFIAASTAASANNNTPLPVNVPTGTVDGDLMIAFVRTASSPAFMTGWACIGGSFESSSTLGGFLVFAKIAAGEGATVNVSCDGNGTREVVLATYRLGKARDMRINQFPVVQRINAAGTGDTLALVPTRKSRLIVCASSAFASAISAPGMTSRVNYNGSMTRMVLLDEEVQKGAGTAKTVTWASGNNSVLTSFLL